MIMTVCVGNRRGAGENLYKNIINEMPVLNEVIALVPNAYKEEEFSSTIARIIVENISSAKGYWKKIIAYISVMRKINKTIKKEKIDKVVFFMDSAYLCILIYLFNRKLRYSLLLHDPILHDGGKFKERLCRSIAFKTYFKRLDSIIVTYKGAIRELKKDKRFEQYLGKVTVINLPQMTEQEFNDIESGKNNIEYDYIFWGRIEKYKGIDCLVEAFKSKELLGLNLLIVGEGSEENNLKKMIGNFSNISFINSFVTDRDLARYICKARFVILPYKAATGSQTVMLANYYGKLVIATKTGCFNEYIVDGKNGFLFESCSIENIKNIILKVNDVNPIEYKDLINEEYKKYDIKRIAGQYYETIFS